MELRAVFALASQAGTVIGTVIMAFYLLSLSTGLTTTAVAQTREMKRIAVVWPNPRGPQNADLVRTFDDELAARGWTNGKTVHLVHRFADGKGGAVLDSLAGETVRSNPNVVMAANDVAAFSLLRHTTTLPIVIAVSTDPVATGLAASLARPGGNVTGLAAGPPVIWGKRLQILKEAIAGLRRVVILHNPDSPGRRSDLEALDKAASVEGLQLIPVVAREAAEIGAALQALPSHGADGLLVLTDIFNYRMREEITSRAVGLRLPSVYGYDQFCDAGGLLCYAEDIVSAYRRSADYVDRILRGADPATMPIELPVHYQLTVNARMALKMGLTLSPSVLSRADRLIE